MYNEILEVNMAKGFRAPKVPNQMGMMGQLQKLQEQIQVAQARLSEETVTITAGGGAMTVTMTGDQRCTAITLDPEILKDADAEMLQDLILTAVNNALDKSRDLASSRLGPLTGGLPF